MQPKQILAFRKRLKNCGYTDIKISVSKYQDGFFDISAVEPLGHKKITVSLSLGQCIDFKSKNS
ncbi:MAG: hypothetical protein ACI4I4_06990 [Acutalibacteraceae bacterium]